MFSLLFGFLRLFQPEKTIKIIKERRGLRPTGPLGQGILDSRSLAGKEGISLRFLNNVFYVVRFDPCEIDGIYSVKKISEKEAKKIDEMGWEAYLDLYTSGQYEAEEEDM